jgi:hypothetical protein
MLSMGSNLRAPALAISGPGDSQLIVIRHIFWNICHSGSERMIRMPKSSINGSLNKSEDRLHVDKPMITIRSLLLSCAAIVTIIVLLHASSIVPSNQNCIAGIATILGKIRQKDLFEQFCSRTTQRRLQNYDFSSTVLAPSCLRLVGVGYKFFMAHSNIDPRLLHHGTE